jgi:hypothetical protein
VFRMQVEGADRWLMQGTVNLVTVAKASGIKKIVLITSIGVDDPFFPLNLFGGVRSHFICTY